MRLLVSGDRDWTDRDAIGRTLTHFMFDGNRDAVAYIDRARELV